MSMAVGLYRPMLKVSRMPRLATTAMPPEDGGDMLHT
jgi:hypothetical protein